SASGPRTTAGSSSGWTPAATTRIRSTWWTPVRRAVARDQRDLVVQGQAHDLRRRDDPPLAPSALHGARHDSGCSTSSESEFPYLNPKLLDVFEPFFATGIAAWLWGHEHNFVLFQNGLFGLSKGQLLGASAYEERESPYEVD